MLGQYRQFAEAQDEQGVARTFEHEADAMAAKNVDPLHFLQGGAVLRMAFLEQQPVGERHVIRGDRFAVVETRLRAQVEDHPAAVFAVFDGLCDQAVAGGGFVAGRVVLTGADHQRFIELVDPVLQKVGCRNRAAALEGVRVERIESAKCHHPQGAAFRRLGIDPVEMGKAGWVLEYTELRVTMAFADGCACGKAQDQGE